MGSVYLKNKPRVHSLWRYPIKGMPGELITERIVLRTQKGFSGDRILGLWSEETSQKMGKHKKLLSSLDMLEKSALWKVRWLKTAGTALETPCNTTMTIPLSGALLRNTILNEHLQKDVLHARAGHFGYADRKAFFQGHGQKHTISLLNLKRLRDLEPIYGAFIEHSRFRANIVIDEGEMLEDNTSIGSTFVIGSVVLRVVAPIKRCIVINKNPLTGKDHMNLLSCLPDHIMGLYAEVISTGTLAPGDAVKFHLLKKRKR